MLLHNSNINVSIANILLYQKSFYNLSGPKFNNWSWFETLYDLSNAALHPIE